MQEQVKINRKQLALGWLLSFLSGSYPQPGPRHRWQILLTYWPAPLWLTLHPEPKPRPRRRVITLYGKTQLIISADPPAVTRQPRQPYNITLPLSRRTALSSLLIILGLTGTLFFGWQMTGAGNVSIDSGVYQPPAPTEINQQSGNGLERSAPVRLKAASIGLNTRLITLGRTKNGELEVPEPGDIAGWYKYAPTPGEIGPAIMVGHLDSNSGPAVFWNLKSLKPGATIAVVRKDGKTVKFKVTSLKQFKKNDFPTDEVYGNLEHAGLRLITCGGKFNYVSGNYTDNIVVFAKMVGAS